MTSLAPLTARILVFALRRRAIPGKRRRKRGNANLAITRGITASSPSLPLSSSCGRKITTPTPLPLSPLPVVVVVVVVVVKKRLYRSYIEKPHKKAITTGALRLERG